MKLKASIALFISVALTVACNGAAPSATPAADVTSRATNQINVALTLDQANRVTGAISEKGGTLSTTASDGARYSLEVPPRALPGLTEVTLTPITSIVGMPPEGEVLAAVHFSPEGLVFQLPTTVTVELPAGVDPKEVTGFTFAGDGEGETGIPWRSKARF